MVVPEHVYSAAVNGDLNVLREYFASGDRDPNDTLERNGRTLLDGVCAGSLRHAVISPPGYPVQTTEEYAIKCEAVSFLLSQGASVDFQDPSGTWHRPLVIAAATCAEYGCNGVEPMALLIDAGADVNADPGVGAAEGFTAIMQAIVENDIDVLKFLLSRGARLDAGIETRRARALSQCRLHGVGRAATRREVDEQTLEDWCRLIIETQAGYDVQIERYRRAPMIKFLGDFRAAGGTVKKFFWAPRADLCMLRILCEQGRASPRLGQIGERMAFPRIVDREEHDLLVRVFAWAPAHRTDARRRTRSAQVHATASQSPLPRDVFKLVISFWAPSREVWWNGGYGSFCKYNSRWIG
ncbi:unnamed protein product [Pelagomonas calceolata]|uniref:Uncharacterized protein n=2 Tax=Pelagomonas calceolata TaxID=35677 RepID=A0A8J2WY85_9STRA|nr:unnamed protein product [Pelagomonas calceolata]